MAQENTYSKRFKFTVVQKKWIKYWKENQIYSFDINDDRQVFAIDTPPPFVSGTLHLGHILNHSWIDFVARYQRMMGRYNVYLPQGYDTRGLPVELAVEKEYGISKEDRDLFLAKCTEWVDQNIINMTRQLDDLGYSTDWDHTYATYDDKYMFKIQWSLLYFYNKGWLYREKFPTHFCVNCETSVSKAEVGYRDEKGKLWYMKMPLVGRDNEFITIATTRPEYVEACVGVFIHPNDDRYYDLSAAEIKIPLTNRTVRVQMDKNVDMNFGTGIVYCCTYGDEMDIKWKLKYNLDEIQIFNEDGRMNENSKYKGLTILEAREQTLNDLNEMGLLEKIEDYDHRIVIHSERSSCRKPIEFLPIYQWFINVKDFTQEIIESGELMKWYPEKHKQRLIDWCESLDWNWVISRQRVFGTPIPFWYCDDCGEIIPPNEEDLPLDPVKTSPPLSECPKCKSKNIVGEKDVCDCWIDSSLTPLAISKWLEDDEFFEKTYMKAKVHRPQGYEIIRTWLFYTLFRCKKLTGKAPFHEIMINGMVAGPLGRKMSKSLGNYISPDEVMPEFGADAIRQWAALGTLGDDYPFKYNWINIHTKQPVSDDTINKEMKNLPKVKFEKKYRKRYEQLIAASRFLTKVWNAYRFLYFNLSKIDLLDIDIKISELFSVDSYFYSEFNKIEKTVKLALDGYNWHDAFITLKTFFWNEMCDNYIEAIKYKFYSDDNKIREIALKNSLNLFYNILKIFAIIMPFISEEIYSILFKKYKKSKSIHLETWPTSYDNISEESAKEGKLGIEIIKILRNYKSKLKIPLNQEVLKIIIFSDNNKLKLIDNLKNDIKNTIRIKKLEIYEKSQENSIKNKPELKEAIEELGIIFYFSNK